MGNPKNQAAEDKKVFDAQMAQMLDAYVMPGFAKIAAQANWGLERGGIDVTVDEAFRKPTEKLEETYDMAGKAVQATYRQKMLTSGGESIFGANALTDAIKEANQKLGFQKSAAENNLMLQKDEAKLESYMNLTNLLNKEGGTLLDLARGNSVNWGNSIDMISGANKWVGAATGAASGAIAGSVVPGVGTAVGAIVGGLLGGVGGYFGSGG